jgi:hypothetical protein
MIDGNHTIPANRIFQCAEFQLKIISDFAVKKIQINRRIKVRKTMVINS